MRTARIFVHVDKVTDSTRTTGKSAKESPVPEATGLLLTTDRRRARTKNGWVLGQLAQPSVAKAIQLTDRDIRVVAMMGDGTQVNHRIAKQPSAQSLIHPTKVKSILWNVHQRPYMVNCAISNVKMATR